MVGGDGVFIEEMNEMGVGKRWEWRVRKMGIVGEIRGWLEIKVGKVGGGRGRDKDFGGWFFRIMDEEKGGWWVRWEGRREDRGGRRGYNNGMKGLEVGVVLEKRGVNCKDW